MRRIVKLGIELLTTLLIACSEKEVTPINFVKVQYAGMNGEAFLDYESFVNYLVEPETENKKELLDMLTYSFVDSLVFAHWINQKDLVLVTL